MKSSLPDSPEDTLRLAAANWIVRRDRGLSVAESIEFELWLAADPSHATAMQRASATWSALDGIPDAVAATILAGETRRRSFWRRTLVTSSLAAAAVIGLGLFLAGRSTPIDASSPTTVFNAPGSPRILTLSDGSVVQLNTGGEVVEQFTAAERRIILRHGEAHFSVTKNPARPFIVRADHLEVRAVGTAFAVNLQSAAVDVIVTEGRVQLARTSGKTPAMAGPDLNAGERAVLHHALTSTADLNQTFVRSRPDATEIATALAWREPLLRLGGATLAELAVEFERGTGKRLVFADPLLAELRFGGRFRADDIQGFTQVLAATLELEVEHVADGSIVLRKKISSPR